MANVPDSPEQFGAGAPHLPQPILKDAPSRSASREVVVVDIQMPFGSMVTFMVKWAIAAIPALIILFILGTFVVAFLGAAFRAH